MTTAAANDVKYARELAEVCANEGRSVGINWSFSPVTAWISVTITFILPAIPSARLIGTPPMAGIIRH